MNEWIGELKNVAEQQHGQILAIVHLLIEKGVITEEEWEEMAATAEKYIEKVFSE